MERKVLRDLFPRDVFHFLGEDEVWTVLVKYTDDRITIRNGDNIREVHNGNLFVVRVKKKEEKIQNKIYYSELTNEYNPHIYKGLYISLVFLVSLTLGLMVFLSFVGH